MEFITVFTPTFNRKKTLKRLYNSLCVQTVQDFIWLIIDDGSTDFTEDEVAKWKQEKKIKIEYIYKENHGLSSGYNRAIEELKTELAVCVDSDDYMPVNAIELIQEKWKKCVKLDGCAGIVGLDAKEDGTILGSKFDENEKIDFLVFNDKEEDRADRKIVVRSDLYKAVAPVKLYPDERGISPHILHMEISKKYWFAPLNSILCTVDYQPNGMGMSMIRQYVESPKSFADTKEYGLRYMKCSFLRHIKMAIHYDASCIIGKQLKSRMLTMPRKYLTWTLLPVGYLASRVILKKYRNRMKAKQT